MKNIKYSCSIDDAYQRLDYVLKKIFSEYGTRSIKRFCEQGLVHVNNKTAKASYKVKENDIITVLEQKHSDNEEPIFIIAEDHNYLALYKKPFLHSEHHTGKQEHSIEYYVHKNYCEDFILLNRLDYATSGILVFAKHQTAENQWKIFQRANKIEKSYLAITEGKIQNPLCIKNAIYSNKRKAVLVNSEIGNRITKVKPLAINPNKNCSLVDCTIFQGARHQIRAHLAYLKFPLVGDSKYGSQSKIFDKQNSCSLLQEMHALDNSFMQNKEYFLDQNQQEFLNNFAINTADYITYKEHFCLHHYRLISPNFSAFVLPPFWKELPDTIHQILLSKNVHEKKILF